uniref:Uncharacterized protein n=1 Tax=Mastacembelus armatus TaxID=205130 RepID=A0A7N8YC60_9TELE
MVLFYNIRMVQLFKDSNLLIDPLQGSFGLKRTLRGCFGSTRGRLTWETCLPHQPLLGQHLHRLQVRKAEKEVDGEEDKRKRKRGWKGPVGKRSREKLNTNVDKKEEYVRAQ